MKRYRAFIAGNPKSINLQNFRSLVGDYFSDTEVSADINFGIRNFFSAFVQTRRELTAYKPDIIILYQLNLTAFITLLANKRRIPVLAVGVGSDVLLMPKRNFIFGKMLRYILSHSTHYNAGSDYLASQMRLYCPAGIDVMIANLGITPVEPTEKQNIIYSNRLHSPLYRVEFIIKAFANFVRKPVYADWKLVVAGCGREKEFSDLAKALSIGDKVEITGWLTPSQNAEYYAKSMVYVSIPISDGVPASLMEAVSAKCLPVLSNIPAYESLTENGLQAVMLSDEEIGNCDFLGKALTCGTAEMMELNSKFVHTFSDKEINRMRFMDLFDEIFASRKP